MGNLQLFPHLTNDTTQNKLIDFESFLLKALRR